MKYDKRPYFLKLQHGPIPLTEASHSVDIGKQSPYSTYVMSFQGVLNINHKSVLDISLYQPLKSFICVLDWNYFYLWVNFVSSTEVYHFLSVFRTSSPTSSDGFHPCQEANARSPLGWQFLAYQGSETPLLIFKL